MCSNTFLPRAFARLGAFYFAPLASPPYLTFAVSPCLTWKTRRNWITGNDDLRTNGLSGDGISRRRGEAPREERKKKEWQARRREMLSSIDEHSIDSSSHGVSLQETFVPLCIHPVDAAEREGENWVTMSPLPLPKVARYGNEVRLDANRGASTIILVIPLRLQELSLHRIPPPRFFFALRDKALFQDFPFSLHRTDITYRLLTGGQGLIPWREPGSGECVQNLSVYAFPGTFSLKLRHFSRIFNRWEQLVFGAKQSPGGFLRSDYDI